MTPSIAFIPVPEKVSTCLTHFRGVKETCRGIKPPDVVYLFRIVKPEVEPCADADFQHPALGQGNYLLAQTGECLMTADKVRDPWPNIVFEKFHYFLVSDHQNQI